MRKKYNEFGPKGSETAPEGGFVDPEEVFSAIFGGERFVSIIGDISLGKEMKSALQEADEAEQGAAEGENKRLKDSKGKDILSFHDRMTSTSDARTPVADSVKMLSLRSRFSTSFATRASRAAERWWSGRVKTFSRMEN